MNRARSFTSVPNIRSSSARLPAISRTGPAASVTFGCIECGSHFTQSQCGIASGEAHTLTRMSSGSGTR